MYPAEIPPDQEKKNGQNACYRDSRCLNTSCSAPESVVGLFAFGNVLYCKHNAGCRFAGFKRGGIQMDITQRAVLCLPPGFNGQGFLPKVQLLQLPVDPGILALIRIEQALSLPQQFLPAVAKQPGNIVVDDDNGAVFNRSDTRMCGTHEAPQGLLCGNIGIQTRLLSIHAGRTQHGYNQHQCVQRFYKNLTGSKAFGNTPVIFSHHRTVPPLDYYRPGAQTLITQGRNTRAVCPTPDSAGPCVFMLFVHGLLLR